MTERGGVTEDGTNGNRDPRCELGSQTKSTEYPKSVFVLRTIVLVLGWCAKIDFCHVVTDLTGHNKVECQVEARIGSAVRRLQVAYTRSMLWTLHGRMDVINPYACACAAGRGEPPRPCPRRRTREAPT